MPKSPLKTRTPPAKRPAGLGNLTIDGATFEVGDEVRFPLTDAQVSKIGDPAALGIPSLNVFSSLLTLTGEPPTTGHLDASVILPLSGADLLEAHKVFARLFRDSGMPQWIGMAMSYHWRTFIMFQGMHVTHDPKENARVRAMYERVVQVASDRGWGIYRTHAAFMDMVVNTYAYNGHALLRLPETLKDSLDPKGILSPGRYGIWPKHLKEKKA